MKKSQRARLDSLSRIQQFLDTNDAALGTINKATSRRDLDAAVTQLNVFAADQSLKKTELTGRTKVKKDARDDLRLLHMQPIAAIARKKFGNTQVIQDLKLPSKSASDTTLLAEGAAMVKAASQYTQVFLDQQMPADFIAELETSVQTLEAIVAAHAITQGLLTKATEGVRNQFSITFTDVRVLNALVVKALKAQPDLLAMWRQMKRVKAGAVSTTVLTAAFVPAPGPALVPAPTATSVAPATTAPPAVVPAPKAA